MRDSLPAPPPGHDIEIDAGHPALDLANTANRPEADPDFAHEHLGTYADLLRFAELAGTLGPPERRGLEAAARRDPARAGAVLRRARGLREAVFRAFDALAAGRTPSEADLELIARERSEAEGHARLDADGPAVRWEWAERGHPLERPLWPLARAAAELLVSERRADVRECAAGDCQWLFMDESRNRSRRWCSMRSCGNRAKVRRYYERSRSGAKEHGGSTA